MNIYTIGIDPGKSGGIVALRNGHIVDVCTMPPNPRALYDHFLYLGFPGVTKRDTTYIFLENVHSMPQDGVRAAFTFGHGLGQLETVIALLSPVDPLKVNPAEWMKYYGLKRDKDKLESKYDFKKRIKEKALEIAPTSFANKLTLKTCDAFLIAEYGYRLKCFGPSPIEAKNGTQPRSNDVTRKEKMDKATTES